MTDLSLRSNPYDPITEPFKYIAHAARMWLEGTKAGTVACDWGDIEIEMVLIETARMSEDDAILAIQVDDGLLLVDLESGPTLMIDPASGRITRLLPL